MGVAEMVYERVKALPEPLAREVLDFASSLTDRPDKARWDDLKSAQGTALAALWDNPEDAAWDDV